MLPLRDYQNLAIQSLRSGFGHGLKRLVLCMPTGSGKTLTALSMVMAAIAKSPKRVMFVCNRKQLVHQAATVFASHGVPCGVVQAENTRDLSHQVIIASIQSLATRGLPDDVGLIIFDEAHFVAGSKQAKELIFKHNLVPTIGLSATPFANGMAKHYEQLNGPLFQDLVLATTIKELIELGFLVDADIYAPSEPDMTGYKLQETSHGKDYSDKDAASASDKPKLIGDIVEHWTRLAYGTPTVVFASSVGHSNHICERFQQSGISAEHMDANTPDDERRAIFRRFDDGETLILCNVGVLCEGWDAPHCKTMILARPTRSLIRYIQMAGRVLRPSEGKNRALILDHSGSVSQLGFPTDDLPMELDDGKPKKSSTADAKKKEEPLPKVCPECSYVKPPKTAKCPQCGLVTKAHALVETAEGSLSLAKGKKKQQLPDKQQTYSGLLWWAQKHGHRSGWVSHKYRAMFGVWPKGMREISAPPSDQLFSWIKSQNIRFAFARKNTGVENAAR